eukprot:357816-Chlamydomonas_euryale.AAC.4
MKRDGGTRIKRDGGGHHCYPIGRGGERLGHQRTWKTCRKKEGGREVGVAGSAAQLLARENGTEGG